MAFENLFSPIDLGPFSIRNRIVMPALGTNLASRRGEVTPQLLEHYRARARGGAGMIIVEGTSVHFSGRGFPFQLNVDHDDLIPGLRELTEAVHNEGARILIQLHHGGRNTDSRISGVQPIAPSAVRSPVGVETPRAMSAAEIENMIDTFASSAVRAKKAGFDGVEVHGAHEYLVSQFMSPYSNFRRDRYGGSPARRLRFAREIVQCIRAETGPDFLISFRISGDEYVPKGMHIKDSIAAAKSLVNAGVDVIDVSGGVYETPHLIISPMVLKQGVHIHLSEQMKKEIKVPVIGVGRINTPGFAERVLSENKADLVAMGRAFVSDPEWPRKTREGRTQEIRRCLGCNQGCIDFLMAGRPITCTYNPSVGRDKEYAIVKTSHPKRVAVLGGGPAGLEAARVMSRMGHEVILYEESDRLGGQVVLAGMLPGKRDFHHVITYYENTLKRLDVTIRLGEKVDSEGVLAQKPDVVIVATGSVTMIPDIPGIENPNVLSVRQVLMDGKEVGKHVVVLGGGNTGSEIAEHLSQRGHTVSILEMGNKIAADIGPARRYLLMRRLRENKVRNYLLCRIKSLHPDRVLYIRQTADGHRSLRELAGVDTFVNALGMRARDDLARELAGRVEKLFVIGDALHPGKILDAVAEGAAIARMIENGQQPLD